MYDHLVDTRREKVDATLHSAAEICFVDLDLLTRFPMPSPNGFHFHLLLLNFHEMWQFFEINLGIFYQIWNLLLDPVPIIGKNQRFSQIFGQSV